MTKPVPSSKHTASGILRCSPSRRQEAYRISFWVSNTKEENYIGVSGGVEPVFAIFYTRRSESFGNQKFRVFHSTVQAYLDMKGLTEEAQHRSLEELLPAHFHRTAHVIAPDIRVKIQGNVPALH